MSESRVAYQTKDEVFVCIPEAHPIFATKWQYKMEEYPFLYNKATEDIKYLRLPLNRNYHLYFSLNFSFDLMSLAENPIWATKSPGSAVHCCVRSS